MSSSLFMQMEVEEEKQHEGIQQYYITKIEALQVTCRNWATYMYVLVEKVFHFLCFTYLPI